MSFIAAFWYFNKMVFYTSFSGEIPVSRQELNIDDEDNKNTLIGIRIVCGCFMLEAVLLGFGISFLCLGIMFKWAIAMTVIGAIGLAIYLVIAIEIARSVIRVASNSDRKLGPKDIPKGYEIGDSFIPIIKPKEEENKDAIKK